MYYSEDDFYEKTPTRKSFLETLYDHKGKIAVGVIGAGLAARHASPVYISGVKSGLSKKDSAINAGKYTLNSIGSATASAVGMGSRYVAEKSRDIKLKSNSRVGEAKRRAGIWAY